jgi:L-ascorbate metabolism protein UlaG (beta-lactamase superfamily)
VPDDERVTWVGHATVLLELGGARLLTDPVLGARLAHLRRQVALPRPEVSERIDAILISHAHRDHLDVASLRRLARSPLVVVPRGAARPVRRLGFARIEELAAGNRITVRSATVTAVPAVHDGVEALGYEVAGAQRVYFAGDTDLFAGMEALAGRLDVALLPVWGWGPSLGPGHMDPLTAARALQLLRPRIAIPIHWGTLFPAGLARIRGRALETPPRAFVAHAATLAPEVDVRVLAPGEALALPARAA